MLTDYFVAVLLDMTGIAVLLNIVDSECCRNESPKSDCISLLIGIKGREKI